MVRERLKLVGADHADAVGLINEAKPPSQKAEQPISACQASKVRTAGQA